MSVRKVGESYMLDVSDGRGGRIRKMIGTSKSVAELVEQDLRVKIAKQVHLGIYEAVSTTFEEYATQWLERKKKKLALSTWRDYRSIFDLYAIPHFGKIPMSRITTRDAEDFVENLGDLSGKRKNNICVPAKCLFNDAKKRKDITENPFSEVEKFREEKVFTDPLSIQEMRLFLETVEPEYQAYFFTCFFTGMRPNEMLALKWVNVDLTHLKMISVKEGRVQGVEGPPKTDSSYRDIDILAPLLEVLKKTSGGIPSQCCPRLHRSQGSPAGCKQPAKAHLVSHARQVRPQEAHDVSNPPYVRLPDALHGRGPLMGGPDAGPYEHGDALPALREVHPEPDAQGRRAFPGRIAGGGMGNGEACAAVELFYGRITADVKKGLRK